jgi:tetratricopeptide (TPR) repeat protein
MRSTSRRRALALQSQARGPDDSEAADFLDGLGDIQFGRGLYAEEESNLRRALAVQERALSPDDPRLAVTRAAFGSVCNALARYQEEEGFYRRAVSIRENSAITNFDRALPPPQSDLAQEVTKDPYNFDFLMLSEEAQERDLERGLLEHLRKFLRELGVGFAFVGSQYPLIGGERKTSASICYFIISSSVATR